MGYGLHVFSQNLPAQVERKRIVSQAADSCLNHAKKCEEKKIPFTDKDFFTCINFLRSISKKYDVPMPSNAVHELNQIMIDSRDGYPGSDMSPWAKALTLFALMSLLFCISFLLRHPKESTAFMRKVMQKITIAIQLPYKEVSFGIYCNQIIKWAHYNSRPPTGYSTSNDKVPWIINFSCIL